MICGSCTAFLVRRLDEPPGVPVGLGEAVPAGLVQLESCSTFSGPARAAVHTLKYDGERRLAEPLGALLAARWRRAGVAADLLVPVPVHPGRLRERGFNQAELLAQVAGRRLGIAVLPALRREQVTEAQHGLGRGARASNVGGAFVADGRLSHHLRGRWVVLVDDVVTTGATLSACAAALTRAGATAVAGLAFARER